jgi:glutaredoxin/glutathione-dependent peroxiredoxin
LTSTFRPAAWPGLRSKRYSMLVLDGVVKELNIEPEPGKADLSSAEHLLGQIK